jgi:hypothetical protein
MEATHNLKKLIPTIPFLFGLAAALAPNTTQAAIQYDFSVLVTGDPPQGTSPFATLIIQNAGANTVDMTLTHNAGSASGQFLTKLLLNIEPFPGSPTLTHSSSKITGFGFGLDAFNDASGRFDMYLDFETSNRNGGADRLKPGESVTWQVSAPGLDESHFLALSQGNLNVPALLHLQGIPGGGSAKLSPVPEPASLLALLAGVAAMAGRRRKR